MDKIPFNIRPYVGTELDYISQAVLDNRKVSGDGPFSKKCSQWLEERFKTSKALLTTSGTAALEMAAMLSNVGPGDEVILPSYTFTTTATSFANTGARLVFVDVRKDTMNIDETKIEAAITDKTRVIVAVHYAGVSCEMDAILDIAKRHSLIVVEDAAQAVMSSYKGRACGTMGDYGCYSFHETKNYSMGEGGALMVNRACDVERAEIVWEKGTDRSRFFRGQVDKYTWQDKGSSFLPSEINAAYLWAQLECADKINDDRLRTWAAYWQAFEHLQEQGRVELPCIPDQCTHNAHMFYLKLNDLADRSAFIEHMAQAGILCVFHYVPLHSSPAGQRFGRFHGTDEFTTSESERLVRLPLYFALGLADRERVIDRALDYFD